MPQYHSKTRLNRDQKQPAPKHQRMCSLEGNHASFFTRHYLAPHVGADFGEIVVSYLPIEALLLAVARGEQDQAEAMIRQDPALVLMKGKVTDYSNRTFHGITAFQYALWALDWHMWVMIQTYLPRAEQVRQCREWEAQEQPEHGHHFRFAPLLEAYQVLRDHWRSWDWEACVKHWCTVVGGVQRLLPAHVVQEYTTPDRPFYPLPIKRQLG